MNMEHDFTPDPRTVNKKEPRTRYWLPERIAIAGIFVAAWMVSGLHYLVYGL